MRNLKRALSLTLASVMLLGMMVVGAGAAGFPDVADDNDNVEAIEVLQAIEVMVGNADTGNFEPDRSVTRTEMAVVMANLLKLDYKYYEASCPFWDVPTWARPYVGACYANKIVSGYGDGTYGALDPITPVQAASMMMRALGYFQYSEDYKDGFETATVRQGTQIGIFEGIGSSADKDMTRGQVARMALNALESEMVTFTGTPGTTYTTSTGESITVGYVAKYEPRTSTELKYKAIEDRTSDASLDSNHRGQYYIQLGEELYDGKLTKKFDRDEFERPSINWQYDSKEIGTYVDYDLKKAEYTTGVTGSELYDLLTYTTINDYDLLGFVDGVDSKLVKNDLVRSNKNDINQSGTGVLTEVFVDQFRDEITVTSINTWLAKANSDYNSTNESLSLKVFTNSTYDSANNRKNVSSTTKIVDSADVPQAADVKKDDYKLVYMSGKENAANPEVVRMYDVEILSDNAVTKFSIDGEGNGKKVVKSLTADGTEYSANAKAFYDYGGVLYEYNETLLTDMSYNIYLDRYGNAIGVDLHEGAKNYVFITGYDRLGSNIAVRTADAAAIFLDGTMDVITVNVTDTNKNIEKSTNGQFTKWSNNATNGKLAENRWYTYTVSNNGVYTLKPVERMFWTDYADLNNNVVTEKVLNTANLYVDDSKTTPDTYKNQGRVYGNDDSIYITVEADIVDTSVGKKSAITDVKGVYTGAQNVKIELTKSDKYEVEEAYVYSVYDSNYYIIASVVLGDAQGASANYAYILSGAKNEEVRVENGSNVYYWEFDAVLNGEKTTLTARTKYTSAIMGLDKYHVQELRFDGDYVTKVEDVKNEKVMKLNTAAVTDKMDVYDVGHVDTATAKLVGGDYQTDTHAWKAEDSDAYGYSNHRIDGTIEFDGRTLYTERVKDGNNKYDVGLAVTGDAKAVLVQYENRDRQVIPCGSVSEAIGRLADAQPDNNLFPGTQFKGRIVAVLNSAGAAEWVVIISDTELRTNDPGYGNGKYTLDLFGDLGNTNYIYPTTVTATLNGVSTVITGTPIYDRNDDGSVRYGAGTRYQIQAGSLVTIQDIDIKENKLIASNITSGEIKDNYDDRITRNNRNNTLTIDRMSGGVIIVTDSNPFVSNKVNLTVTNNDGAVVTMADGSAVPTQINANTSFDLKVTAAAGDITVTSTSGAVVDKGDGIYTIPGSNSAINVVISVEQKEPGEVSVTVTKGRANVVKGSEKVEKVFENDVITLDPAEALTITAGATDNGDGTWTVTGDLTIAPKSGYIWNGLFYMWMKMNADGTQTGVPNKFEWTVAPAAAAAASQFKLGRAAEGEVVIDITNPNWIRDYLTGEKAFEIRVQLDNGTMVTFTGWFSDMTLTLKPDENASPEDIEKASEAMGVNDKTEVVETEKPDVPNPPAEKDEKCYATVSGSTLTMHKYGKAAPTKEEIVNAVLAAFPDDGLTADDITVTSSKVTIKDAEYTLTAGASTVKLFKVTLPGGTVKYVKDGGEITGIGSDIRWLVDADIVASNTAPTTDYGFLAVTGGKVTFYADDAAEGDKSHNNNIDKATYWDYTLVKALKVNSGTATTEKVYIESSDKVANPTGWMELTNLHDSNGAKAWYIQDGKALMITTTVGTAGETATYKINGKQFVTGTRDASGIANIRVASITEWDKDAPDEVTIEAQGAGLFIKWGDKIVKNPDTPDGSWPASGTVDLGFEAEDGLWIAGNVANTVVTFAPGGRRYITWSDQTATEDDQKTVQYNKAYQVSWPNSNPDYTVSDPKTGSDKLTIESGKYVKAGYALQVVAKSAKTTLVPKDGSKWTLGAPTFDAKVNDGKATYSITLDKNIAEGEFEVGLSTTVTEADLVAVAKDDDKAQAVVAAGDQAGTFDIAVTGIKETTPVSAKWLGYMGTADSLAKLTITCENNEGEKKIVVTLTNNTSKAITLQAMCGGDSSASPAVPAADAETGVLEVTVGDLTFNVNVTVKEANNP